MSDQHAHHITPISTLFKTFLALTALMLLTIWSSYWNFSSPVWNNAINLGIAVIKASLVISIFMGVKWASRLTRMFALAGFVWLTLVFITFGDYSTRSWEPTNGWNAGEGPSAPLESEARSPLAKELSNKVEVHNSGGGLPEAHSPETP